MDLSIWVCYTLLLNLAFSVPLSKGATFTFVNKCDYTVWPGILPNAGTPTLGSTGFELPSLTSRSFQAPAGWSGRFWGRTTCTASGTTTAFSCATGDCGSASPDCNGAGAQPPVTLAEFTLGTSGGLDFYDVSLVDGYNLPILVEPMTSSSSAAECASTGCLTDLNTACPEELKSGNGEACKSACEAFGSPEYCCSGASTCKPSIYSQMFKSACPRSYSYAYDDASSTFTCSAADYSITFCPSSSSQKSTTPETPVMTTPTTTTTTPTPTTTPTTTTTTPDNASGGSQLGSGSMSFEGSTLTGYDGGSSSGTETTAMVADGSWLAGMAMGDSPKTANPLPLLLLLLLLSFLANLGLFVS